MRFLLDTHLLIWAGSNSPRLSGRARALILSPENQLAVSVVSLWETVIKRASGHPGFDSDPVTLRRTIHDSGYEELEVAGNHVLAVADLPPIHGDPFDRLLIAQAMVEGMTLLTADKIVASYPGPIELV